MRGISKAFPGVKALKGVNFDLREGEVHALVGENGAGKSTLMKILSGLYRADEGEIELRGRVLKSPDPRSMLDAGISVIYQELNLIGGLSIAENIFLGREPRFRSGLIHWKAMYAAVDELLDSFKVSLNPRTKVHTISPAFQQVVEILKALSLKSRIIVMDEPTAPLTGGEVDRLFEIIDNLKEQGVSIIYISHRLEELGHVADRVTVLRDGECIVTKPLEQLTVDEIISRMVGRRLTDQYPGNPHRCGEEILRVEGLSRAGVCSDVSFSVRRGEIVGFTGLVGAGRTEIMELIYGHRKKDSGRILLHGREAKIRGPGDAVRRGLGFIPEERKKQGLVLSLSVFDNAGLTVLDKFSRFGFLKRKLIAARVQGMVRDMAIKTPSAGQAVKNLSGGNQQKVVLSKWFMCKCDVYIFDEPTRGIDVGAKAEIYRLMRKLTAEGAGIIMVSSELTEVMNMSDRLMVVHSGRIVKEFGRGEAGEEEVMEYSLGLRGRGVPA